MWRKAALCLALSVLPTMASAAATYQLAPFRDALFQYPNVVETRDDGDYVVVGYDKQRDLYGRDQVPERRVWSQYVKTVRKTNARYVVDGKDLKFVGGGKFDGGARAVVIYVHGQGGDRFQGANDWMFGGNFNRVMNLMAQNSGAYISPDFTDIDAKGTAEIKLLLLDQARRSPNAAIFVACGSQGGAICWNLARDPGVTPHLSGLLLLGSMHDDAFIKSPALRPGGRKIPIYIGHGTEDPIFAWQDEVAFYESVRKASPGYPIRIALFATGVHGTPIRMTDWRLTLNWMLAAAPQP
jgi:predicted esterase